MTELIENNFLKHVDKIFYAETNEYCILLYHLK